MAIRTITNPGCDCCGVLHDYSEHLAPADGEYEYYQEVHVITERRDGAIYKTVSRGHCWLPTRHAPQGTDVLYSSPTDLFARENMTVRRVTPV